MQACFKKANFFTARKKMCKSSFVRISVKDAPNSEVYTLAAIKFENMPQCRFVNAPLMIK